MAKLSDPIWRRLLSVDGHKDTAVFDRITKVLGISDGGAATEWVLYADLTRGQVLSLRYNSLTHGAAISVSTTRKHIEDDLRLEGVAHRVGVS